MSMQRSIKKRLLKHSFWVSLLLHALLLLSFAIVIVLQPEEEKKHPQIQQVPSYVYKGSIKPSAPPVSAKSMQQSPSPQVAEKSHPKPNDKPVSKHGTYPKSILAASLATLKQEQIKAMTMSKESEPILMIGDDATYSDPLIKMIGRSLSANFKYPDTEGMLGIRGRVIVEFTLHPEGHITDVHMTKSSNNHNLDAAALYSVNKAPTIEGANRFLSQPTHFVVGFIFS